MWLCVMSLLCDGMIVVPLIGWWGFDRGGRDPLSALLSVLWWDRWGFLTPGREGRMAWLGVAAPRPGGLGVRIPGWRHTGTCQGVY